MIKSTLISFMVSRYGLKYSFLTYLIQGSLSVFGASSRGNSIVGVVSDGPNKESGSQVRLQIAAAQRGGRHTHVLFYLILTFTKKPILLLLSEVRLVPWVLLLYSVMPHILTRRTQILIFQHPQNFLPLFRFLISDLRHAILDTRKLTSFGTICGSSLLIKHIRTLQMLKSSSSRSG